MGQLHPAVLQALLEAAEDDEPDEFEEWRREPEPRPVFIATLLGDTADGKEVPGFEVFLPRREHRRLAAFAKLACLGEVEALARVLQLGFEAALEGELPA
jgi:hypothetical protein